MSRPHPGSRAHPLRPDREAGHPAHGTSGSPDRRSGRWRDRSTTSSARSTGAPSERSGCWSPPSTKKKMAEDRPPISRERASRCYMHHDIDTMERMEIIRDLRLGTFDVLGGHQPAAGGAGPARGESGGHPGRGQGGLPTLRRPPSSRPLAGRPATPTAWWSCMPTRSPPPCAGPSAETERGQGQAGRLQSGPRHRCPKTVIKVGAGAHPPLGGGERDREAKHASKMTQKRGGRPPSRSWKRR